MLLVLDLISSAGWFSVNCSAAKMSNALLAASSVYRTLVYHQYVIGEYLDNDEESGSE